MEQCWRDLPHYYRNVVLDEYVIMPNHFHGIILLDDDLWADLKRADFQWADLKSAPTGKINGSNGVSGMRIWQRGYYDHIIRNELEFNAIREYIDNNPLNCDVDKENPMNIKE